MCSLSDRRDYNIAESRQASKFSGFYFWKSWRWWKDWRTKYYDHKGEEGFPQDRNKRPPGWGRRMGGLQTGLSSWEKRELRPCFPRTRKVQFQWRKNYIVHWGKQHYRQPLNNFHSPSASRNSRRIPVFLECHVSKRCLDLNKPWSISHVLLYNKVTTLKLKG